MHVYGPRFASMGMKNSIFFYAINEALCDNIKSIKRINKYLPADAAIEVFFI